MAYAENIAVFHKNTPNDSPEDTREIGYLRVLTSLSDLAISTSMGQTEIGLEADRSTETFRLSRNPDTYEVSIDSDITVEDYRRITSPEDWALLEQQAERLRGKKVVFINPTLEGGGVAMLRPPLIHLLRQLNVDAHWYVMEGRKNPDDPNPFDFTKLMHNISQRCLPPDVRITEEGKAIHQQWNAENAEVLIKQETIQTADIIVIDDPQPAPLKRHIEAINPTVKWVWRNHIDTDGRLMADLSTPQGEVASYILDECGIRDADAIITHPVEAFVHPDMWDKTFFAPATIEPHDDLNRPLTEEEIKEGIVFINGEITAKNTELAAEGRLQDLQGLVDPTRRRIILVARFDESKGMDKAMALGVRTRQKMRANGMPETSLPQVIIVGNGSVDDPSGVPMYEKMLRLRRENYPDAKKDIILMRLKHNYKAMNALMYPTTSVDNKADPAPVIGIQTSDAEGCETRISDWIRHGVPVVVANRGGMPLQVAEGQSGIVLDFDKPSYDIERGAGFIGELMASPEKYVSLCESTQKMAETFNNREFTTTANVIRLLRVFYHVLTDTPADKQWKISEIPGL
jgi:glycosyltransferase involved in cell wall biosynthesis